MPLQIRRGTDAERIAMTQPLAAGELLWITDLQRLYIGNGNTLPSSLVSVTGYTDENAQDAAASLLTAGTHTGITFTYGSTQDGANRIDAAVNLSNYTGTIKADAFKGTLVGDDSTILVDGVSGKINLDGTVKGSIIPSATETYDIGSSSYKFKDLYLSGSSIHLGGAIITASGSAVNLPVGSTVNGVLIGSGSGDGVIEGSTYKINIAASDSSLMVNTDSETVTASGGFIGNLTGNVTGNADTVTNGVYTNGSYANPSWIVSLAGSKVSGTISANLIGDVSGNLTGNVTGNVNGILDGDMTGSVFGDGSTLLVDGVAGKIVGPVESTSVTGNIYGRYVEISGVSTTDPSVKAGIRIITDGNADDAYDLFSIEGAKEDNNSMSIVYKRSRGTIGSEAPLQNGDEILGQFWFGADSASDQQLAAAILASVDAAPSAGIVPGNLAFATSNASGVITTGLSINSSQTIGVAGGTNLLVAGGSSGQVNTGSVTGYLKINIGGVDRAIPYYSIN